MDTVSSDQPGKGVPSRVGKVKLAGLLGCGSIGSVYRGYHETLDIDVAVKLLNPEISEDQKAVDRFVAEARITAHINHPNIIRVYDCDLEDNLCYLVMEFVDGENCEQMVRRHGRLNEAESVRIIRSVVLGLAEAARCGMLHHDIKPANILIGKDGVVKLGDMGAAIMLGYHGAGIDEQEESYLTLEFAAPERMLTDTETDIRSDIYSIGATLYYLLTGQTVRKRTSSDEVSLTDLVQQPVVPVRSLAPEISSICESVLDRLLKTDPAERYHDYAELLAALSEVDGVAVTLPMVSVARSPDQLVRIFKQAALFWYRNIAELSKTGGIVAGASFLTAALSWGLFGYVFHLGSRIIIAANLILLAAVSGPLILGQFIFVMNLFIKPGQKPDLLDLLKGFGAWQAGAAIFLGCEGAALLADLIFRGPFFFVSMLIGIISKGLGCYAFYLVATAQVRLRNLAGGTYAAAKKDLTGLLAVGLAFWIVEYLMAGCLHPVVYMAALVIVLPFFATLMFCLNQEANRRIT